MSAAQKELLATADWLDERVAVLSRIPFEPEHLPAIGIEIARMKGRAALLRVVAEKAEGGAA